MTTSLIVAGTDTDIGKTIFAAALCAATGLPYWKPVQAGLSGETDSMIVRRLASCVVRPEAYRLTIPASPHAAAEAEGISIDPAQIVPPPQPHVIELAGGLMVPLTRDLLQIDLVARWRLPVVLVASTRLGTINHSLLSLEALRARAIPLRGIAFIGPANDDSERAICEFSGARRLGRLPIIAHLDAATLRAAFAENFRAEDFR